MSHILRKTRIICTLGPVTETPERLREMMLAGTNIFRLNMSHANHDWVRMIVPSIRSIAEELGLIVGILMDTQGPAVRTGDLPSKSSLALATNEDTNEDVRYGNFLDVHGAVCNHHLLHHIPAVFQH